MSVWTVLGLGATATAGTAAAAAVVVIGTVGYFVILPQFQDEEPEAPTEIVQQAGPEEAAPDPEDTVELAPTPQTPEAVEAAPRPPSFDVVRVDGLGSALVAGIADPGKMIDVLLDGASVSEASTGGDGRFVALFDISAQRPATQPAIVDAAGGWRGLVRRDDPDRSLRASGGRGRAARDHTHA